MSFKSASAVGYNAPTLNIMRSMEYLFSIDGSNAYSTGSPTILHNFKRTSLFFNYKYY